MDIDSFILFIPIKKIVLAIDRHNNKRKERFLKETREWLIKEKHILENHTDRLNKLIVENEKRYAILENINQRIEGNK